MKMLRRSRPDDSATEYPSPHLIAGSNTSMMGGVNEAWGERKEGQDSTEMDALIGCLASMLYCCIAPQQGPCSWLSVRSMGAIVLILLGGFGVYSLAGNDDPGNSVRWKATFMPTTTSEDSTEVSYFDKKPVGAVISTHHRTGTVLFQNMGERLCEVFFMDYERVDEPFKLQEPDATRTLLFQRYWNTSERLVAGMHGFAESCPGGEEVGMYCETLDFDCWLSACSAVDQDVNADEIPVAHVVRNPVEILISAYLYHQQDPPPEEWLYYPKPDALEILSDEDQQKYEYVPYYKVLQDLPPEDGILVEFTVENEEIYRMARNYRDMAGKKYALNLHFEDFKKDFRTNVRSILDHLQITDKYGLGEVMDIAMIFDLDSMPEIERKAYQVENHITEGKHNKDDLRRMLYNNVTTRHMLNSLAKVMEYESAFPSTPSVQTPA